MLIVEIGGKASLLSETVLSYLFSYAIKQVIWKQKFASNKFHIREIVATVAKKKKKAISLMAMAGFRMDSNVVKCY